MVAKDAGPGGLVQLLLLLLHATGARAMAKEVKVTVAQKLKEKKADMAILYPPRSVP